MDWFGCIPVLTLAARAIPRVLLTGRVDWQMLEYKSLYETIGEVNEKCNF